MSCSLCLGRKRHRNTHETVRKIGRIVLPRLSPSRRIHDQDGAAPISNIVGVHWGTQGRMLVAHVLRLVAHVLRLVDHSCDYQMTPILDCYLHAENFSAAMMSLAASRLHKHDTPNSIPPTSREATSYANTLLGPVRHTPTQTLLSRCCTRSVRYMPSSSPLDSLS